MAAIDTDALSDRLRQRSIRLETKQLLISRIGDSSQAADLTEPPNCAGYGRIRHFRRACRDPWPDNGLPIDPASHRLGVRAGDAMTAQVFQNAACNWRCWYCYVPFNMLAANERTSGWLTADQLIELYLAETNRPLIIDCSGGQPDLVPEWIPWMMKALRRYRLDQEVYLWSDDNLSNSYFWQFLDASDRHLLVNYRLYGRVCCFKGFDSQSFAFNTKADPCLFERQFELFRDLFNLGIDLYAYATFTADSDDHLPQKMTSFVDRLQEIHPNLPLRLVPLRIETFGVAQHRIKPIHERAMQIQETAVRQWNLELGNRFDTRERRLSIARVNIGR